MNTFSSWYHQFITWQTQGRRLYNLLVYQLLGILVWLFIRNYTGKLTFDLFWTPKQLGYKNLPVFLAVECHSLGRLYTDSGHIAHAESGNETPDRRIDILHFNPLATLTGTGKISNVCSMNLVFNQCTIIRFNEFRNYINLSCIQSYQIDC